MLLLDSSIKTTSCSAEGASGGVNTGCAQNLAAVVAKDLAPRGSPHKEHGRQNEQRAPGCEANNAVPERFGHIPFGAAAANNGEPLGEGIAGDLGSTVQRSETGVGHKVFGERGKERAEEGEDDDHAVGDGDRVLTGDQKPDGESHESEDEGTEDAQGCAENLLANRHLNTSQPPGNVHSDYGQCRHNEGHGRLGEQIFAGAEWGERKLPAPSGGIFDYGEAAD